jgi:hypothetical protein
VGGDRALAGYGLRLARVHSVAYGFRLLCPHRRPSADRRDVRAGNTWDPASLAEIPPPREQHVSVWTGNADGSSGAGSA